MDFLEREKTVISFPPLLTDMSTCNAIKQFQLHINHVIAYINNVCAYCSLFIPFGTGTLLTKIHPEFVSTIKATIIINDHLDYCGYTDNSFYFYNFWYSMRVTKKILKCRSANCINVLACQKYSDVFNDLTPIKKVFIPWVYPVMSVINFYL